MRQYYLLVLFSCMAGIPVLAEDCTSIAQPCSTKSEEAQQRRRDKIRELYNYLPYPAPISIVSVPPGISVEDLFETSVVRGRVTPIGQFAGFEAVREYFFGFAANPASRVEGVKIRKLVSSDTDVAVDVDIAFCQQPAPCGPVPLESGVSFTLTQTGFFTFNSDDKIIAFDLTIPNLGAILDPQSQTDRDTAINQVCGFLTLQSGPDTPGTCPTYFDNADAYSGTGYQFNANLPLPAFSNCVAFMHSIPYGSWNRANSNTFVCRQVHSLLTPLRPEVHCPHTSPSGALTCVDMPYSSFYTTNLFDFSAKPVHGAHDH